MTNKPNFFLQLLSSVPVILIVLYFSTFLGLILILFRFFVNRGKKSNKSLPILLFVVGLIVFIPKAVYELLKLIKIDIATVPFLGDIIDSTLYTKNFMSYGKTLIFVGVIVAIVSYIFKVIYNKAVDKLNSSFSNFVQNEQQTSREIREKNDLIMREKKEKSKNTHFVKCRYCGGDNVFVGKIGSCKYCRRNLVSDEEIK